MTEKRRLILFGLCFAILEALLIALVDRPVSEWARTLDATHPALIEAMGRGALVLYRNTPENAEVAGGVGIPFTHENILEVMRTVLAMSEKERESLRARAMERVRSRYSWDAVTDSYESLLTSLTR